MKSYNTRNMIAQLFAGLTALTLVTACTDQTADTKSSSVANADAVCSDKGSVLSTLGPHAVCVFEDNRQCSVEAVKADRCIEYGNKITGYENDQQAYCAVSGHSANLSTLQCELVSGEKCSFDEFWEGKCP